MGTVSGDGGDHLANRNVRDGFGGSGDHMCQTVLRGVCSFSVVVVVGGRADQGIAVYGGCHKDSLAVLAGKLEDRVAYKSSGCLVQ